MYTEYARDVPSTTHVHHRPHIAPCRITHDTPSPENKRRLEACQYPAGHASQLLIDLLINTISLPSRHSTGQTEQPLPPHWTRQLPPEVGNGSKHSAAIACGAVIINISGKLGLLFYRSQTLYGPHPGGGGAMYAGRGNLIYLFFISNFQNNNTPNPNCHKTKPINTS